MNTCDTCKWWKAPKRIWEMDSGRNHGECASPYNETEEDGAAAVANGEPYNAGTLATGPKFGCIHHEPK